MCMQCIFLPHTIFNSQLSLMASSSIFLLLILFHLLLATEPTSSVRTPTVREQTGFRAPLTRVSYNKNLPKFTSTNPSKKGSPASPINTQLKDSSDVYLMSLAIGTPHVTISAIMDTGSNLIWTKCKSSGSGSFDTSKSSSFSKLDDTCEGFHPYCKQEYEDGKSVSVSLGKETITVGDHETIPNVTFSCGKPNYNDPFCGIVGMGPGELSLVSHLKKRVFAYCLGSRFDTKASSILLTGSKASIQNRGVQTVPLVTGDSYYRISLEGISVGPTRLPVRTSDIAISNKDGGMVIDSGTTFTYLENSIVDMISNEFMNQTKLNKCEDNNITRYGLKHCFKYQGYKKAKLPKVVFHFEGANWELKKENYIYEKKGGQEGCLAFIANDQDSDKSTIFGNMQQQNMMVIFDLEKKSLSFKSVLNCNRF